jgi:hypothetical protein
VNELANNMPAHERNRKTYPEASSMPARTRCMAGRDEVLVAAATKLLVDTYREVYR